MLSDTNQWIEVRNDKNKLLFKYNPITNTIELYGGNAVYQYIKLDEIREKYGVPVHIPIDVIGVEVLE